MCKVEEEAGDHILFHCMKVCILWQLIFALYGVKWVMHSLVRELLLSLLGSFVGKKRKKTWKVALLFLFWTIWRERNRRTFDICESLVQTIINSFLYLFLNWVSLYIEDGSLSLLGFVETG